MLGLADHGMAAIKSLPALYENYAKGEGIEVRGFNVFLGKKKISHGLDSAETLAKLKEARGDSSPENFNFIVDRNYIVAALARYLKDTHENDPHYTSRYETKCQYVDYENRRVLVRDFKTNDEEYVSYDLLVGCDGVRSTVREALVKLHSNFHLEYTDNFSEFKQAHVEQPPGINPSAVSILPDIFPHFGAIVLPETGGLANITIGCPRYKFDDIDDELKSDDYKVVSAYVREKFKAFELVDYDDFAKQWVAQRWNQTGMIHFNFYHSLKASIVIMGDAAHATSPTIGMGMNTALRDAEIFSSILEETNDAFEQALPSFSDARVKEGNSLSDLAFNLFCLDNTQQMLETIHSVVRSYFYMKFPRFVNEHPISMIGRRGVSLSECYDQAVKLGIMNKHRVINNRIRMQHFEQKSGMIQTPSNQGRSMFSKVVVLGAALAAGGAYAYQNVV